MVDNYCIVPNRAERRKKQKLTIGKIGHIDNKSSKAKNVIKNKRTMKEFVGGK